ncbi:MAG: TIGR03067 domain-containing protein [Gemmataceae bacterium]|nr:TIGR03067 domain-containing protein [Gemmataceae bacterium]
MSEVRPETPPPGPLPYEGRGSSEETPPPNPLPGAERGNRPGSGFPPPPLAGEGAGGRGFRTYALPAAVVLLAGVALWYAFSNRDTRDDHARLQGDWAVSANGREGVVTVRVEGDRWTYLAGGIERQSYRLTLRPEASPKEIDLAQLDADEKAATNTVGRKDLLVGLHGVYAFDGDAVKVVLAPGVEPRPKSVTDTGDAQVLTLTRATR